MTKYKLWYFIEGEDFLDRVTISKDETVGRLRGEIHGMCSQNYCNGVDTLQLVLLKVDIDPPNQEAIHELHALAPSGKAPILILG